MGIMPNHAPSAIANIFIKKYSKECLPSQMCIQKLVYISHGWTLAISGHPLVSESPEAWDNGPVFRSIWDQIKNFGYKQDEDGYRLLFNFETKDPFKANLTAQEDKIIQHVWNKYGDLSGVDMSNMTHKTGTPWYNAYMSKGRNADLDREEIKNHFINLAMVGREQATSE